MGSVTAVSPSFTGWTTRGTTPASGLELAMSALYFKDARSRSAPCLESPAKHFPVLVLGSIPRNVSHFCCLRSGCRFGHWFWHVRVCKSRNHLVRHGDRVDGGGNFDRAFSHVFFIDSLVGVEVGVMRE